MEYTKESIKLWTKVHSQVKREQKTKWFSKQIPLFAIALNRSKRINCRKWKSVEDSSSRWMFFFLCVFKTIAQRMMSAENSKRLTEKTAQCRLDARWNQNAYKITQSHHYQLIEHTHPHWRSKWNAENESEHQLQPHTNLHLWKSFSNRITYTWSLVFCLCIRTI